MIVLAGGIGSGKSVVARILRLKGFGVYDCDFYAKSIMECDPKVKAEIAAVCGAKIYNSDGRLNRKCLASEIFNNPEKRNEINRIVHKAVRDSIRLWLDRDIKNIFVETAIAAESGLAEMADQIWFVNASLESRKARIISRDKRPVSEIIKIIEAQSLEEDILCSRFNVVRIENNDNDTLIPYINELCGKLSLVRRYSGQEI